jgi:hypothetical protein
VRRIGSIPAPAKYAALALGVAAAAVHAQSVPDTCQFRDVVRAPDVPAILDPKSWQHPDFSGILLPLKASTATAWLRISDGGRVTDVCVVDAPADFRAPIADVARELVYVPGREGDRPVATAVAVQYQIRARIAGSGIAEQIATSEDVSYLEAIATSATVAEEAWRSQKRSSGEPKDLRVTAYTRLGELATPESLAAQRRVAEAFRGRSLIPGTVRLRDRLPHPGWHMTDPQLIPMAQALTADGTKVMVTAQDFLGPRQLFIASCDGPQCTRPKPVGPWNWRYVRVDSSLEEVSPGRFRMTVVPLGASKPSIMDGTAPAGAQPAPSTNPETRDIVLADFDRDSDSDGWTDIEEQTLGLDPTRRDSDRDGVDDGHDRAPLYAPSRDDASDEEAAILRAAIFAVFGLTESRWALFAKDENVRKLEVPGLSAPVLFHRPLRYDPAVGGPGGAFVTWRILRKSATEATVEITDWEGPLAAGGQNVFLRRINDGWVVIARQTTWIS